MIKYKWCVCDMDGTLLDSKGHITKENEEALKRLQQDGTEVIIASGRIDLMVKSYIKQLDLRGHVISCNGGLIRNIESGEIVYSNTMNKTIVKEVLTYCIVNKIDYLVYTADLVYSNTENPRAAKYEKLNKSLPEDLRLPLDYVNNTVIENLDNIDVLKILLVFDDHAEVKLMEKYFAKYKELTVVSSAIGLLDIMATNTSKGHALKLLSKKLKVDLKQVIAFGDNYNDMEMLQCVGMPIAMENSVEELKLAARHVTRTNDESGIAYAIDNLIYHE